MSTLVYLNGHGDAVTVAVGNPPLDEDGQPIYPPVESMVDASDFSEFPTEMLVPTQAICNGLIIAEAMVVGEDRALIPAKSNSRARLRQALAQHDALLQLQVLPRLTVEGVKTDAVLQVFGKLQAAKCPFGLMAFSSSSSGSSVRSETTHISLAAMGPLVFGDFMGALAHFLNATAATTTPDTATTATTATTMKMHYTLALSTHQTRQGDYGMEGEEWIECLFGSKEARTPFAALQGSGAAWTTCTDAYTQPNNVYEGLAEEVERLGKILGDVLDDVVDVVDVVDES